MTAEVQLRDKEGNFIRCRALLDTCATANFLTENMARKLKLQIESCNLTVSAIDDIKTAANGLIPNDIFPRENIKIPSNLRLADPKFHLPQGIDLLIGAGATLSLFCIGQINLSQGNYDLYAQKTLIGWIIKHFTVPSSERKSCVIRDSNECEIHYKSNTIRDNQGRYIVRLPFKTNRPDLGNSRIIALRRFYGIIRRLKNDPDLAKEIQGVMQEYIDTGHMSLASSEEDEGYYLPHHAVIKKNSLTTKVRIVFDASAKSDRGISLNDVLLTGPILQDKLFEHLVRMRLHKYMITADIEKMYRQILVNKMDRRYQRILWFHQGEIRTFELNTVTFGISSSSFLAIRTLKQLAEDEGERYPIGSEVLKGNLYVGDLLSGADNLQEIFNIRDELIALLKKGGFRIRKWASNHPHAVDFLDEKMTDIEFLRDESSTKKTLGVFWNAATDELSYTVAAIELTDKITKRGILSEIAKIFDLLGLLGPVIFLAKVILQECWKTKVSWDETVTLTLKEKWSCFARQLPLLNDLAIERCLLIDITDKIQVHGFCDASKMGYGACLYVKSSDQKGNAKIQLICSKSRVASIKEVTIPRMELNGALTLARLYKEIRFLIKRQIEKIIFWCDSTIVLHWIGKSPINLKTYEANRIREIQDLSRGIEWRHVRTHDNPADCLFRGQAAGEFLKNVIWFKGPSWLKGQEDLWPPTVQSIVLNNEGERLKSCLLAETTDYNFIDKFSSYSRLIRVVAYCRRFISTSKGIGSLKNEELDQAEIRILNIVQSERFSKELKYLKEGQEIKENRLASLNLLLDDNGLICVGGRLIKAKIKLSQKRSILLPARHHLTDLIMREVHERSYHAGVHSTLYSTRYRFWILDGKNQVRKIVRSCIRCRRFNAKPINYKMADLPASRVDI
ncbi:uncharacterized protein [Prorops nasuta]|uniref:uncharacterized protein n=1 Tax=Prorops nasuta TaxID=863751 RepID=UPI0034CE5A2C